MKLKEEMRSSAWLVVVVLLLAGSVPATATMWKWSTTAATNSNADSTINFTEGQAPGTLNDSGRGMMAAIAKYRDDLGNTGQSGGTAGAYTLTTSQGLTAFTDDFTVSFVAHVANSASATINVDGLGAKPLAIVANTAIGAGVLAAGGMYTVSYDAGNDEWLVQGVITDPSPFPAGVVMDYVGSTAPSGWLLANGQAVSRTTYADLFALISTTYGAGDGSTTFNLPDYRGRVVAGSDTMGTTAAGRLTSATMDSNGQTIGDTGGAETHSLTLDQLASHSHPGTSLSISTASEHTHAVQDGGHHHLRNDYRTGISVQSGSGSEGVVRASGETSTQGFNATTGVVIANSGAHNHTVAGNTGASGSSSAHNNIQPTAITYKIIKF